MIFAVLFLAAAGKSAADPREAAVGSAIARASAWLDGVQVAPFLYGATSFRLFAMEIEARHRLWLAARGESSRKSELDQQIRGRLAQALDAEKLREVLTGEDGALCFTEMAVLAKRCRDHGLDPAPFGSALDANLDRLRADVDRLPPSLQVLHAVYLPAAGIDLGLDAAQLRRKGMIAGRPAEADLTLAEIYYLTHEIFAHTDYGALPLTGFSEGEERFRGRALSFFAIVYGSVNNLDILSEILICMASAGLADGWAYEEGIRVLVERQNQDGSFGGPDPRSLGRPLLPTDFLHATMNGLGCLLLDSAGRRGP